MITLYKHQKLALAYMRANCSFALFLDPGCGKTLPTLTRLLELFKSHSIETALVVCKKSGMGAWWRDIEKFEPADQTLFNSFLTVINYDKVWRGDTYRRQWDAIVVDESHKMKNRTSRRAEFLLERSRSSKYRYILTGTPVGNGQLENLWAQYAFLSPTVTARGRPSSEWFGSYSDFLSKYCLCNQWHQPYAYKHVDEFQAIMNAHCMRVKKSDCLDLPEKLPDEIYDIELKEPKLYKELHKSSTVEELDILADNPLARMAKLRQVCSGFINDAATTHELACEKADVLDDFLEDFSDKLVIFAEFTHSIDTICGVLTKRKLKHVVLDGRTKDKTVWRLFQSDDSIKVIVCQYQSGCDSIDLFAADTTIYYEPTISSTTLEQSRDRTHRSGQHRPCSYIHFITKGTIEVNIYKALAGYADFSEKLFTEYMTEYTKSYGQKERCR